MGPRTNDGEISRYDIGPESSIRATVMIQSIDGAWIDSKQRAKLSIR